MHSYFPDGILWVYLLVAVITNTSVGVVRVMVCRVHICARDQVYGAEHKT